MNTPDEQTGPKDRGTTVEENSIDNTIWGLYEQGLTIMESIKVLISDYGMSLREAKTLVSAHPAFQSATKAAEPLHDELVRIWKKTD